MQTELKLVTRAELRSDWIVGDREDDVFVPYARCQRLLVAPRVADHDCSRRTIKSTPTAFAAALLQAPRPSPDASEGRP